MDLIDHCRGDLGDPWKDRSGFKHKYQLQVGKMAESVLVWKLGRSVALPRHISMIGWFEVNESANELGSVISVSCLDVYLGKDTMTLTVREVIL